MAIANITKALRKETGDGYTTLKKAITNSNLKEITRRDAVYLLNKQMEGISETKGNLYIYMFYYSCTDPVDGNTADPEWYKKVTEDNGRAESTPWCGCYVSFILNFAGISSVGHWSSLIGNIGPKVGLTEINSFDQAKSMDTVHFLRAGGGHIGFAVKEDPSAANNWNETLHVLGGNQGNKVSLGAQSWFGDVVAFGTKSNYEEKISAGDMLSCLAYFTDAHTKTSSARVVNIQGRINKEASVGTQLSGDVRKTRKLIGENFEFGKGTYIKDKNIRERFKELLVFEESLRDGGPVVTGNISEENDSAENKVT